MKIFSRYFRFCQYVIVAVMVTMGWTAIGEAFDVAAASPKQQPGAIEMVAKTIERQMVGGRRRTPDDAIAPTHADVAYGPRERNHLDFWQAESSEPSPLVVYFHGGGFCGGDKSEFSRNTRRLRHLLDNGVSAATVNYPFIFTDDLLTIMRDCARAVQFIRSNAAAWNIDPQRVVVYGESAGAGASLWMAFNDDQADPKNDDPVLRQSTRVLAAGALAPQATYEFSTWPSFLVLPPWLWDTCSGMVCPLFYHMEKEDLEGEQGSYMRKNLDMVAFIDSSDPPVFMRSTYDTIPSTSWDHMLHHPGHAFLVRDACAEHGVPCTLITKDTPEEERVDVLDFLLGHLGIAPKE